MKLPKKIAALLTVTLVTSSAGSLGYADTIKSVSEDKLVGSGRWETAIEVSKKGWSKADEAIIVNDNAIADALAATPFAEAKNAPILLTGKDKLDERTKAELKRLGVKKVYLIGGEAVLTKNIENQLKAENLEIDRIQGANRELTAIEIANRLDKIKDIEKIAVVNGTTGLADAVSIAAVAAREDMAIILSNPVNGIELSNEFIKNEDIKTSYIIGGVNAISKDVASKLPNANRIEGINRNETNAKVLETFYTEKEINNAYVAKDGMGKEDQLIDALAVGVLAAKNDSPVIIVGNKLNQMQKDVTNTKSFKTVTQVGGNGNETAFGELKTMQGVNTYEVNTVAELNNALAKADANDVINVRALKDNSRNGKVEIASKNAVNINLHETSGKSVVVNVTSGTLAAHGKHTSIDIKGGDLVINGTVESINVLDGGEVTVSNKGTSKPNVNVAEGASVEVAGSINTITVSGKDAQVNVAEGSTVSKVEVSENASGTVIENNGKVDNVVSNAPNVNVENSGTVGNVSGTNKPTINEGTVKPPSTDDTVKPPSTGGGSQNITYAVQVGKTKYKTIEEAINAAPSGSTIKVLSDINIKNTIKVDKNLTLDLNGKTISNSTNIWDTNKKDWSLISVRGGHLTITGNGKLDALENDCYAIDLYGGNCTIEDGTFVGNTTTVYAHTGHLVVNGGDFSIKQLPSNVTDDKERYTLNCLDTNYKNKTATITVKGGSFKNFNPENNKAEGVATDFVFKGHTVIETIEDQNTIIYRVVSDTTLPEISVCNPHIITPDNNINIVTTSSTIDIRGEANDNIGIASMEYKINSGQSVVLEGTEDWVINQLPLTPGENIITIVVTDKADNKQEVVIKVIYENEASIVSANNFFQTAQTAKSGEYVVDGTVYVTKLNKFASDAKVTYKGGTFDFTDLQSYDVIPANGSDITFINSKIKCATDKIYTGITHADQLTYVNCEIEGQFFAYSANTKFVNCTFKTKDPMNYNIWTYGSNVTFENCKFESAGKSVLVYNEGGNTKVDLKDCTFTTSLDVLKAAIEISGQFSQPTVTIENCTQTGFKKKGLWFVKDKTNNPIVIVDGNTQNY